VTLHKDLDEGSHFVTSVHLKTGIIPVPFKFSCNLCGSVCGFKIPVLEKEISIEMPPCPIKAAHADKVFQELVPDEPLPLLKLGFDGITNVFASDGKEIAAVHFTGFVKKKFEDGQDETIQLKL